MVESSGYPCALDFADFSFVTLSGLQNGTYTLFHTNTAINGSLASSGLQGSIGTAAGTLSLANNGQDIVLTVVGVPEPTTIAGIALGSGLMLLRRRRK